MGSSWSGLPTGMEKRKVKRTSSLRIGWILDPPVIEVLCRFTNISVKTAGGISKRSCLGMIHRQIVLTVTVQTWRNNSPCLRLRDLLQVTWQNKVVGAAALRSPVCAEIGGHLHKLLKFAQSFFEFGLFRQPSPNFLTPPATP